MPASSHTTRVSPQKNEYYVLFSKKAPNGKILAEKFDLGLNKIKKPGQYDKIPTEYSDMIH
jgi:ABC-type amino acid transport substrate-binding protein